MKPLAEQTLYELLEVSQDAPESEIVRAWERVEAMYGPSSLATYTLVSPEDATLLGRRLEEALNVLLDPVARRAYDEHLSQAPASSPLPPRAAAPRRPPIIPPLAVPESANEETSPTPPPMVLGASMAATKPEPTPVPIPAPELEGPTLTPLPFAALSAVPPSPTPVPIRVEASELEVDLREESFGAPGEPEPASYTGEVLRRAREARGMSIQQMCERTKITRHHLENVEADRYDKLPASVYLRGILMAMSKELRLDGQKVARSYLEAIAAAGTPPVKTR